MIELLLADHRFPQLLVLRTLFIARAVYTPDKIADIAVIHSLEIGDYVTRQLQISALMLARLSRKADIASAIFVRQISIDFSSDTENSFIMRRSLFHEYMSLTRPSATYPGLASSKLRSISSSEMVKAIPNVKVPYQILFQFQQCSTTARVSQTHSSPASMTLLGTYSSSVSNSLVLVRLAS